MIFILVDLLYNVTSRVDKTLNNSLVREVESYGIDLKHSIGGVGVDY